MSLQSYILAANLLELLIYLLSQQLRERNLSLIQKQRLREFSAQSNMHPTQSQFETLLTNVASTHLSGTTVITDVHLVSCVILNFPLFVLLAHL